MNRMLILFWRQSDGLLRYGRNQADHRTCSIQAFVTQHLAERALKTIALQRFDSTVELLEAGFVQVVVMVAVAALSLLSAVALLLMAMDGRNVRSVSALWRSGQLVRVRSSSPQPGSAW